MTADPAEAWPEVTLEKDIDHLLYELRLMQEDEEDAPPEMIALATATAVFSKAFLETLGNRVRDSVANLPKHVRDLLRR